MSSVQLLHLHNLHRCMCIDHCMAIYRRCLRPLICLLLSKLPPVHHGYLTNPVFLWVLVLHIIRNECFASARYNSAYDWCGQYHKVRSVADLDQHNNERFEEILMELGHNYPHLYDDSTVIPAKMLISCLCCMFPLLLFLSWSQSQQYNNLWIFCFWLCCTKAELLKEDTPVSARDD